MTEQFYDHAAGPEGSMILHFSNTTGPGPAAPATSQESNISHVLGGNVTDPFQGDQWGDDFASAYRDEASLLGITAWVEQLPDPDDRVTLNRSRTDHRGNPVPEIIWHLDDRTRNSLEAAQRICRRILTEAGATDVRSIFGPDRPLLLSHRMGTTRMGTDPGRSVVNPELRTHDVENLYISSSGVFVTSGAATPTLTIAALSLRLADHLDARLASR